MICVANPGANGVGNHSPRSLKELLETVSASRLKCFHQCRLKFFFQYVMGLSRAKSPALHIGTTVHSVLQYWNLARWRKEPVFLENLKDVFQTQWNQDDKVSQDGEGAKEHKESAWKLISTYIDQNLIPFDEKIEGVEVPIEANLESLGLPTLIGVLDLVREGGLIVDYKTTSQTPNTDKAAHAHEVQMSAYSILFRHATGQNELGVELHHLVKKKVPTVVVTSQGPMTSDQEVRFYRLLESYILGVEREDFVPSVGLHCISCQYFNECKNWR